MQSRVQRINYLSAFYKTSARDCAIAKRVFNMKPSVDLTLKIKNLYPCPLSDNEAIEAAQRLISFFKILVEIDKQQKKQKEASIGGQT